MILVMKFKNMIMMQKIKDIEGKYITTSDFNRFFGSILNTKLKDAKLTTNNDFHTVEQRAIEK